MSRIFVIWIVMKRNRDARVVVVCAAFCPSNICFRRVDWIKLFLGITLCFQKDSEVVLEAGCNILYVLIKLDKN